MSKGYDNFAELVDFAFCQVAYRWVGNQQATYSSFDGCEQPKSGSIPVSCSIPFSYQFEVKRGFQKQIRLYEQEICLCELKSVIETQIYM